MKTVLAAVALAAVSTAAFAQTAPAPAPAQAQDHSAHAAAPAAHAALPTITSSIKDLLANPATAAVVEKHLPGISQHPALPQVQDMTLAEIAPMSGGQVTPTIIAAIDTDLKALPAH